MKHIWQFFNWIGRVHSGDKTASAKRFYGGIGFICCIVYIGVYDHKLILDLLMISAGLLGLETLMAPLKKDIPADPSKEEIKSVENQKPQ